MLYGLGRIWGNLQEGRRYMKLSKLTVAIKQVLKRPLFEEEKSIYLHQQLDFEMQVVKSARKFGRTARTLADLEERRRMITFMSFGVPLKWLGECSA